MLNELLILYLLEHLNSEVYFFKIYKGIVILFISKGEISRVVFMKKKKI